MANGLRIVVIAHGHPGFEAGGGEVAAYNLFQAYRRHPAVSEALFLARREPEGPPGTIRPVADGEYLIEQAIDDWQLFRGHDRPRAVERFRQWLRATRPDVVHFHHFCHLGIELLRAVKQALPSARLLFTLHEYMAICMHNGQMVKTDSRRLCHGASPEACHDCFPEVSRESLWLRRRFLLRHFAEVDAFVAPSRFLCRRYIEWGIEPSRITVIENAQRESTAPPAEEPRAGEPPNRFGFFGQFTPYKGVETLLRALDRATVDGDRRIFLELHGANLEQQGAEFRKAVRRLAKPLERRGVLGWAGPYEAGELAARMAGVDWVVVPSIWWENSPMVIQEAFTHGRPVIVSDIGGMAEKVRHGVDGLHVPKGNVPRWADTLRRAADDPRLWQRLRGAIVPPDSADRVADRHLALIRDLAGEGPGS